MSELYVTQKGDTLWKISQTFGTTVKDLLKANLICNKSLISVGLPLIVPSPNSKLPRAGASPYYVVQHGDSLWCLARKLKLSLWALARNNQIWNPLWILPGREFILVDSIPNAAELRASWEKAGGSNCEIFEPQAHSLFVDTFAWAALGKAAMPHLLSLLSHTCPEVRFFAAMGLGRIGLDCGAAKGLQQLKNDSDTNAARMADFALRRINLVKKGNTSTHLLLENEQMFAYPSLAQGGKVTKLSRGSEIKVLRWFIPSPGEEEGYRGGILIFDYIMANGQRGFIPRKGQGQIGFI